MHGFCIWFIIDELLVYIYVMQYFHIERVPKYCCTLSFYFPETEGLIFEAVVSSSCVLQGVFD